MEYERGTPDARYGTHPCSKSGHRTRDIVPESLFHPQFASHDGAKTRHSNCSSRGRARAVLEKGQRSSSARPSISIGLGACDMGFIEDVRLTLLLARKYGDQMHEKSLQLPSVKQTAHELVGGITTTLAAASESTDIRTRKLHVASTRVEIAEMKRLAGRCGALKHADLEEAELQILQIESTTTGSRPGV